MRARLMLAALALALGAALAPGAARAEPVTLRYRLLPQWSEDNRDSPFLLPDSFSPSPQRQLTQEAELHVQQGGWNATGTVSALTVERESPQYGRVLNELFLDTHVLGQDVTVGKKVLSWGVGNAFRPLDVIQREKRLDLFISAPEGVPLLAWQHFGAATEWTLVYANPARGEDTAPRLDESVAARVFTTSGGLDLQGVLRLSERNRAQAGAGFAQVLGEAWQLRGEALYLARYERRLNPLAEQGATRLVKVDPTVTERSDNGVQALLGATRSWAGGVSLMAEIWYDDEAYTAKEWDDVIALTERQRALLGKPGVPASAVFGNVGFNSVYFDRTNLLRENVFLRASYTGEKWEPALEGLYTPEDGGWVTTGRLSYQGNRFRFHARVRRFGGPTRSAYGVVPTRGAVLLGLEWSLG